MPPTASRTPLRRDAIVDEARVLIARDGLDALTLRRLADQFSVSAPALYAHFHDKDDLLRAVAERQFDELMARYREIDAAADPARPLDRVRAQCRNYVRMSQQDPELFRVMFLFPPDLGGVLGVPEGSELPAATQAFQMALGALEDAIAAGHLDVQDPLPVALTLWAGVHGIANMLLLGLGLTPEAEDALVAEVTGRILRGYGADA
ncbi:MAG: TetR/AcrR family transcriptional regulator [Acidimicrobiales bacterium]